ncbi:hypothetical protein HOA55_04330 [archaeon]|jgi:hypothetical protein|nr:hypothetical protein [archaeon]MBT3577953.1 hypothetical protein [archaeon]MBT6820556.1 hypothetical protein [archaeon]MBT6955925.1 hypothetical protein [archaeon]MBT7025807.1 hypothetical protein [archaeon]
MEKRYVWEFTNQRKLTKKEFIDYFGRKVFRTIRKYGMLPSNKIIKLKESGDLNTMVLVEVLEKKFKVRLVASGAGANFSSENLSQIAEDVFGNVLGGKFAGPKPEDKKKRPLYFHSDKEVELYAKLVGIKGTKRKQDKKVQSLFEKFLKKNQDLEMNVVGALSQLK